MKTTLRRFCAATAVFAANKAHALGAIAVLLAAVGIAAATTFDQIGTGTNITMTGICSTGCEVTTSGTGIVNANQINAATVPASAGFVGTNASGQLVTQLGVQLANETYSAINSIGCSGTNEGALYFIHDSNVAVGSTITAGGGSNKVLALCDGTNWVAH